MALIPQDRRGQTLVILALLGGALLYFTACGSPIGGLDGVAQLSARRDTLQNRLDSLNTAVRNARRDIATGAIQQLEARLAEYRASLDLMRTLVPAGAEINNLFDDVTSRIKVRGARLSVFTPQGLESGTPFDTQRARVSVEGTFDQIGEILADIGSLPRIVVPYELALSRAEGPRDTTAGRQQAQPLRASFIIRTYVKTTVVDTITPAAQQPGGGQ